ncbi:uncharacterized protein CIMG_03165 [Coccidioides immitis RS]|uniref:Uncharacterized protein n=3 Tax=Coccidioides immitis TaxID=5501 RepID=J3KAR8_COCIM|nr:uncharacterized protein CIMG_03165 [Coccidioides immitis RS]EAS32141.3 hypothetical protein CIMG_03165 [Coccidioides immitis RS]KMP07344.1 hypothetical protein CIRG_07025 [Coccidioides immitis RMSCC 2394]KMU82423.1 hypothetical protein CIHG_00205 [Coccidioides immitis H538.4]
MGPGAGFRAGWAAAGAPKTKIHIWHVTIPNSELREAVINSAPVMFETGRRVSASMPPRSPSVSGSQAKTAHLLAQTAFPHTLKLRSMNSENQTESLLRASSSGMGAC